MSGDEAEPGQVGGRLLRLYPRQRPEDDRSPTPDADAEPAGRVPTAPAVSDVPAAPDASDVTAVREQAQSTAMTAYTAVHGHPLEHLDHGGRRWGMRTRVAVAGSVAIVALGGFVVLRSSQVASVVVDGGAVVDGIGPAGNMVVARRDDDASADGGALAGGGDGGGGARDEEVEPAEGEPAVGEVVVHVVGEVVSPGVVRLPEGARVAAAVGAAGGATSGADLTGVNLARLVLDGEQIVVPAPGESVPAVPGDGAGPLDLNGADADALDELPGIGPVLAERILDWRTTHGRFSSVDELAEVSGIGPALLSDLRDLVRV